jgi:hypothetical protein
MQFPGVVINAESAVVKEDAKIFCIKRIIKNSEGWARVVTIWVLSDNLVTSAVSHIIIFNATQR